MVCPLCSDLQPDPHAVIPCGGDETLSPAVPVTPEDGRSHRHVPASTHPDGEWQAPFEKPVSPFVATVCDSGTRLLPAAKVNAPVDLATLLARVDTL